MTQFASRTFFQPLLAAAAKPGRALRLLGAVALVMAVAGLIVAGLMARPKVGLPERLIADAWQRALDSDPGLALAFEPWSPDTPRLVPAQTGHEAPPLRDLTIGDRITLATPDGRLYVLELCDAASPKAANCLDILAVHRKPAPTPAERQRSL